MDIIKFDWNTKYAVDSHFDLNILREMKKVKESGKKYVPTDDGNIEVVIRANVTFDGEEIEKVNINELTAEKEQYSRWWSESNTEKAKLAERLKCLEAELKTLKEEK